jgi:hypothetical protein
MYTGKYPNLLWEVLQAAWLSGISLQSDFARSQAIHVALGASCGFISTLDAAGTGYGGTWRITEKGLVVLKNKELFS